MMRALYITQYLARNDEPGANRQWDLVQALADRGHHVDVIISGQHYLDPAQSASFAPREPWQGGTLYRLSGVRGYRRSLHRRAANYLIFAGRAALLALRLRGYDLVLASTPSPLVGLVGWLAAFRNRCRLWIEVRDVWPEAAIETGLLRSRGVIALCRRLNAFMYRRAERLVVISPGIHRHLMASYGLSPEKVLVIPNGWARGVFERPGPSPDLEALGIRPDCFRVIYTGAFGVGNNDIPTILESARLLRGETGVQFIFVGDGERRELIESFTREHRLENVVLVGLQPKNVIPHFLAAANVCVLTLPAGEFFELFLQNKVFDYLGSGRPVIAAVAGDQAELIRASHGGIVVPPGDAAALGRAVLQLRDDAAGRNEMGRNARTYVASHYDRTHLIEQYVRSLETTAA